MTETQIWKERIQEAMQQRGLDMKKLSKLSGKGDTFIRDLLIRDRTPSVENLIAIAKALGVRISYLFGEDASITAPESPDTGHLGAAANTQSPHADEPPALSLPKEKRLAIAQAAISSNGNHGIPAGGIPQIDASIGMGHTDAADAVVIPIGRGETMLAHPVRDVWIIPPAALRRFTRAALRDLHLVECEGDSMEPAFHSGDFVLVDTSRKVPSPPGVYALWDGHGMTLKKAELVLRSDPPMVRLIPENSIYQAYELPLEEVTFVGRVVARISGT